MDSRTLFRNIVFYMSELVVQQHYNAVLSIQLPKGFVAHLNCSRKLITWPAPGYNGPQCGALSVCNTCTIHCSCYEVRKNPCRSVLCTITFCNFHVRLYIVYTVQCTVVGNYLSHSHIFAIFAHRFCTYQRPFHLANMVFLCLLLSA